MRIRWLYASEILIHSEFGENGLEFSDGDGSLLANLAYVPAERLRQLDDERLRRLVDLTGRWIRQGTR